MTTCIRCGRPLPLYTLPTAQRLPEILRDEIILGLKGCKDVPLDDGFVNRVANIYWNKCCGSCLTKITGRGERLVYDLPSTSRFLKLVTILKSPRDALVRLLSQPTCSPFDRSQILRAMREPERIATLTNVEAKEILEHMSPGYITEDAPSIRSYVKFTSPRSSKHQMTEYGRNYEGMCQFLVTVWLSTHNAASPESSRRDPHPKTAFWQIQSVDESPPPMPGQTLTSKEQTDRKKAWLGRARDAALISPDVTEQPLSKDILAPSDFDLTGIFYCVYGRAGEAIFHILETYQFQPTRRLILALSHAKQHAVGFIIHARPGYFSLTYYDPNSPHGQLKQSFRYAQSQQNINSFLATYNPTQFARTDDLTLFVFNNTRETPNPPAFDLPQNLEECRNLLYSICTADGRGKFLDALEYLITNTQDQRGLLLTPFKNGSNIAHIACTRGHIDLIQTLINSPYGLELFSARDVDGETTGTIAATMNNSTVITALGNLPYGRELLTAHNEKGDTPGTIAAVMNNSTVITALGILPYGRELLAARDENGDTPGTLAALDSPTVITALGNLPYGRELLTARNRNGDTPGTLAAALDSPTVITALGTLQNGKDILLATDLQHFNAATMAANEGNEGVIEAIAALPCGRDILAALDGNGRTPASVASHQGQVNIFAILQELGTP